MPFCEVCSSAHAWVEGETAGQLVKPMDRELGGKNRARDRDRERQRESEIWLHVLVGVTS